MAENNINYLLLLGNGFDVGCGLRCTYLDFFLYLKRTNFQTGDEDFSNFIFGSENQIAGYRFLNHSSFSVWEYYFVLCYRKEPDIEKLGWFDIEGEIYESLSDGGFWDSVYNELIDYNSQTFIKYRSTTMDEDEFAPASYLLYVTYDTKIFKTTIMDH